MDACASAKAACESDLTASKKQLADANARLKELEASAARDAARLAAYKDLAKRLRDAFGSGDLEILLRNGRLVVQLPNRILYDSGKVELKPEGKAALDKLAGVLKDVRERQFLVAGHTDNVPVKTDNARFRNNWELSTLRGVTVVQYLAAKGVAPTQLGAAGYGENMPEASNDTDEGKAQNRRTEIIIMPLLSEIPEFPKDI